ncbi:MAG: hypothetical protein IPM63_15190 [Acidobacteriota bacterium]|nr:MAG: hypothetical protein IPM63_15190 [Acidobacteriota bacterium]
MVSPGTAALTLYGLWLFFFVFSFVVMVRSVAMAVREGERSSRLVGRAIGAALVYFVSAGVSMLLLVLVFWAEPRRADDFLSFSDFLWCLIVVLLFGFLGWLSSVLVNQGVLNPFSPGFWFEGRDLVEIDLDVKN